MQELWAPFRAGVVSQVKWDKVVEAKTLVEEAHLALLPLFLVFNLADARD